MGCDGMNDGQRKKNDITMREWNKAKTKDEKK
jgi:hypothetical protein